MALLRTFVRWEGSDPTLSLQPSCIVSVHMASAHYPNVRERLNIYSDALSLMFCYSVGIIFVLAFLYYFFCTGHAFFFFS